MRVHGVTANTNNFATATFGGSSCGFRAAGSVAPSAGKEQRQRRQVLIGRHFLAPPVVAEARRGCLGGFVGGRRRRVHPYQCHVAGKVKTAVSVVDEAGPPHCVHFQLDRALATGRAENRKRNVQCFLATASLFRNSNCSHSSSSCGSDTGRNDDDDERTAVATVTTDTPAASRVRCGGNSSAPRGKRKAVASPDGFGRPSPGRREATQCTPKCSPANSSGGGGSMSPLPTGARCSVRNAEEKVRLAAAKTSISSNSKRSGTSFAECQPGGPSR